MSDVEHVCGLCVRDAMINQMTRVAFFNDDGGMEQFYGSADELVSLLKNAYANGKRIEIGPMIVGPPVTTYMGSLVCAAHLLNMPPAMPEYRPAPRAWRPR